MKQIIQSFKTGSTLLEEVPAPLVQRGCVLIQTTRSLVSLGTERTLVEFGRSNIISKARQQPEKVKQVLDKIKSDGLIPTLDAVFNKLGEPLPLGYSNVGIVIAIGDGVTEFKIGDRVASNGHHAEFVCVPKNLVVHVPDNVTDDEAAFTVVGSIGLQGVRLLNPTFGETIVVVGMGLIGLLTAQLLVANGCKVIGTDIDDSKLSMAKAFGVVPFNSMNNDVIKFVEEQTYGIGADGVIITASVKSNDIISQAARMSRKRGRIVLVGVIGLELNRSEFYEKELTFQVSCSYGPGRYDENYEQKGLDYPLPFVRWTEKRNFETILHAISSGRIHVKEMITEKVVLNDYLKIYEGIGTSRSIASIIKYNDRPQLNPSHNIKIFDTKFSSSEGIVGIVGSGNYTKMTMLPALKGTGAGIKYIASNGGITGTALAKKYGIANSTTNYQEILEDHEVDLVMITTRHHLHAKMVIESLNAGKNVFVEKPLSLNLEELEQIIHAQSKSNGSVTVGFNRRFSQHVQKVKQLLGDAPMNVIATMNAGFIPSNVWVHDLKVGGGRIIGEAVHFIDLITFLTGSKVQEVCMNSMGLHPSESTDNASILLKYKNGSTGVINYFSNGSKAYSKERLEIYSQEKTLVIDNFRKTEGFGIKGFSDLRTVLDKGHKSQFDLLIKRTKNGGSPLIPFDEIINTTKASFAAIESLKCKAWVVVS